MLGDSSGTEMDIDIDTTMKTKPPIDREEKLRKVEEKLLSKRTNERFTNYDGVMSDNNLSLPQNKTNDLILNLTPENVTQHSRIVTTMHKESSTPTKMSKIIGRQIH